VRSYIHRIGRTARGGATGTALSLVSFSDDSGGKVKQDKNNKHDAATDDKMILELIQARQQPVMLEDASNVLLKQPAPLAFDIADIDCFRYRVEDVRRAVTSIAIREAQLADVKKEMLNSDKLRAHFEDHPRELNLLQHDRQVGKARIQPHLATIPTYLVPSALQAPVNKKKKKNLNSHAAAASLKKKNQNHKRRTDNDPLHTFEHLQKKKKMPEEENEDENEKRTHDDNEDRITYGDRGVGKSTSNRQKWKASHKKGNFNPKTIAKKAYKASFGAKH
jgi:ATP-dependent RNA helicase DDX56/DBP9